MASTTAQPAPGSGTKRGQACERCWKRKQKCDRLLPACTACADLGAECLARAQEVDLAAEDVGLTHATVHSYMDVLRQRVADLQRSSRQTDAASPPRKRLRTDSFGRTGAVTASMSPPDAAGDDSSVRDTMGAIGFLSNSAMAEPTAGGVGEGEGSALPHRLAHTEVVLAALAVAGHDPSAASASASRFGAAETALLDDHQLPLGRNALLGHVKRFVDSSLMVMVPSYLDENRFIERLDEVAAAAQTSIGISSVLALHRFDAFMAAATGIMMSPDSARSLAFVAASLHGAAVRLLPLILHPSKTLDALHCMCMLFVHALFSPGGGSAWHLLDMAMKTCISAGLHKDPGPGPHPAVDGTGEHDAAWLFWALYVHDRSLSSVMDRPFSIQDSDITVQVPPDEDGTSLEAPSEANRAKRAACRHLIRHAQLISSLRDGGGSPSPIFSYSNLYFWRGSLAPTAGNLRIPAQEWTGYLDQLSCRALMCLIRPGTIQNTHAHVGAPGAADPELLLGNMADVERDAIASCTRLIDRLYTRSRSDAHLSGSFLDAYDALSAAVMLVCLKRRRPSQEPPVSTALAQVLNSINKACAVITDISGRFHGLRTFQELAMKLSLRVMEDGGSQNGSTWARAPGGPDRLPLTVPRRLCQSLDASFA
ncbi:hypothetical protein RB601_000474 [Gaeumannomyces tritici]